jgi:hypothetical protein
VLELLCRSPRLIFQVVGLSRDDVPLVGEGGKLSPRLAKPSVPSALTSQLPTTMDD